MWPYVVSRAAQFLLYVFIWTIVHTRVTRAVSARFRTGVGIGAPSPAGALAGASGGAHAYRSPQGTAPRAGAVQVSRSRKVKRSSSRLSLSSTRDAAYQRGLNVRVGASCASAVN